MFNYQHKMLFTMGQLAKHDQHIAVLNLIAMDIANETQYLKAKKQTGHKKSPDSVILGSAQHSMLSLYHLQKEKSNESLFTHFTLQLRIFLCKHFTVLQVAKLDEVETSMVSDILVQPNLCSMRSRFIYIMLLLFLTRVWRMATFIMTLLGHMKTSMARRGRSPLFGTVQESKLTQSSSYYSNFRLMRLSIVLLLSRITPQLLQMI